LSELEIAKLKKEELYLCCLMTYGCLLRPHREIRELNLEGLFRRP